jgi:hypothetical protein
VVLLLKIQTVAAAALVWLFYVCQQQLTQVLLLDRLPLPQAGYSLLFDLHLPVRIEHDRDIN